MYEENMLYVTLNRHFRGSRAQLVLAEFRIDDFRLQVKPRYTLGEGSGGLLTLRYDPAALELMLDLPFLDYVARRYEGEVAEALSPFYADRLERFKVSLLGSVEMKRTIEPTDIRMLVSTRSGRIEIKRVIISDGKLEVL